MPQDKNLMMPGHPRYQPASLVPFFGYDNLFRYVAEVELATLDVLGDIGLIPPEDMGLLTPEIRNRILDITTTEVDRMEKVTKHDIRAWVRLAQDILPEPLRRWLHVPLTSYDALDTARTLQYWRAHGQVVMPAVCDVIRELAELTERHASQVQIGRTHGQHALPITVGFWLASVLNRIMSNARTMSGARDSLVGKISGAVGAHNAQVGLGIAARCGSKNFETRVLERLGYFPIGPARISTQILPPEPLANYLFACTLLSASLAQFGRDCRHLMRSEIAEVAEAFGATQVGSSTMAQKRNPITFENIEGLWLVTKDAFGWVLDTLLSDHQRDLVGSPVYRYYPIVVINLVQQLETLLKKDQDGRSFLSRITVNTVACDRNFRQSAHLVLAEPVYIALQMAGYAGDAHEVINHRAVPIVQNRGIPLIEAVAELAVDDSDLHDALDRIPRNVLDLLQAPERYVGDAAAKAHEIASAGRIFAATNRSR